MHDHPELVRLLKTTRHIFGPNVALPAGKLGTTIENYYRFLTEREYRTSLDTDQLSALAMLHTAILTEAGSHYEMEKVVAYSTAHGDDISNYLGEALGIDRTRMLLEKKPSSDPPQ